MRRWAWIALSFIALFTLMIEIVVLRGAEHKEYWWSEVPAFSFLFGCAGCIAIIVFSKVLGKLWLQKKEEYYDGA